MHGASGELHETLQDFLPTLLGTLLE